MKVLFVLREAPLGSEDAYHARRLAVSLQREQEDVEVDVFLLGDAVACALPDQKRTQGWHKVERMLAAVIEKGRSSAMRLSSQSGW